ncbi:Odorant receptor 85e [Lucilia cuprina]|uniref:Odorant receptor n=1 Tax=Lucilia cuprina TaxID=7375 RepID=A0A0L0CII5_LUCCU|nr:putative odorant receptor 85e [Lucilia cuprina]KNC32056.1 Odorant receptor 85e [Lucilia cuprina]
MSSNDFHGGSMNVLYSKKDHERRRDLFHLQLFFMKFVGQVPTNLEKYASVQWIGAAKKLARFYCAFSAISTLHLALLYIKTTFDMLQIGELEEITDALTMAIIYSFASFATCYWLWRTKSLRNFLENINNQHRHHSMAGLTFVSVDLSYNLAYKITLYWLRSCMVGVVSWALNPLLLGSYSLPLKCWYPFNPLQPVVYELTYMTQVWCQFIMGCIFGNGSALFVSVIIIMLGQFDILYCSLKNLDYHAQLMSGEDFKYLQKLQSQLLQGEDDELNQYVYSKEYLTDLSVFGSKEVRQKNSLQKVLHESLVECVLLHKFILKSCDALEDLFNPYCLIKSLQITLQLCLLVFVGVAGESSTMRTINLVQYLALTLSELLMFTYFGELLRNHSVRAGEAFFRSQWWPHAHYIKRDIFVFLVNTKRAVKITAGKFYLMDIQRLRSVITQAFSFLTLLQKLAEKNK